MKNFFQIDLIKRMLISVGLIYCLGAVDKLYAQDWVKVNPVFYPSNNHNTYHGFFVDERNGWWITLFPGTIFHTTNKGISWETQVDSCNAWLDGIIFTDSLHGWIASLTLSNDEYEYFLLSTKNGGKSWDRYSAPVINCLTFFDSLNGFAGGDSIYKTTDGGVTWKTMTIESHIGSIGITDIFFIDRKYGWAVGRGWIFDAGFIVNTVDSGKTWQFNDTLTTVGSAIYFTDSLHGYIAGSNPPFFWGMIKVTNNGGKNWLTQYLSGAWMNDVIFTDDSTGWAIGNYGFIGHTTDKGITWQQIESGTTSHLYRIYFFYNGNIGYIVGADSTLLKYQKTVDVIEEKPDLVTSFKVFQNYPNPFNPSTKIKFSLKEPGFVKLEVYDILGSEVAELVNETKSAGNYSIEFDASNLPSGMYIYKLQAGSYTNAKKMVLTK
ncbi:MAG: T9SS type A sorting domain-containing protein [Ignavibacteriaceae bacterium]|nr:T9SS type A sorting domain-containing protein [Ignavibacteriaceae bacterium]